MKLKKIILSILATASIAGGLVVGFNQPKPLTFDEYQTLLKIYNYEIKRAGGKITLGDKDNPVGKNVIKELNKKLLTTSQPASVKIDKTTLTREDYQLLKSGLFKKSEI